MDQQISEEKKAGHTPGPCGSCGLPLPVDDDEGDGTHLESECIENLQGQRDGLLEAAEGALRLIKLLKEKEGFRGVYGWEHVLAMAIAKARGES